MKKTLKRSLAVLLCAVMVLGSAPLSGLVGLDFLDFNSLFSLKANAASSYTEGIYKYTVSNNKATITSCSRTASGWITIPSTLGGYPVTSIGPIAFGGCRLLINVIIPDSVTEIGIGAFSEVLNIAYSEKMIAEGSPWAARTVNKYVEGYLAYSDTSKTELLSCSKAADSIDIPNSVRTINNYAFSNCTSLTNINIPNSVLEIGDNAFYNCESLTNIVIPNSVNNISADAFESCSGLQKIIVSPNNIYFSSDDNGVLYDKYKTELIQYPIGNQRNSFSIPKQISTIGDNAFYNCKNLTDIVIPETVNSIGKRSFAWCTNITNINIPNSVNNIGSEAFYGCSGLTSIVISERLTKLSSGIFENCSSITTVIIPESITKIESYAFAHCSNLKTLIIPNTITEIGIYAFYYCSSLKTVFVPDSVKEISRHTFAYCSDLENIIIPDSVTRIDDDAFCGCENLLYVHISKNITYISKYAFDSHNNLKYICSDSSNPYCKSFAESNGLVFKVCTGHSHASPNDGDYKITLDANGGKFSDGTSTKAFYYDAGENLPSSLLSNNKPTKNGCTFNRWNDILPLTMPPKDIIFKAEWKINIPDEPGEPEYTSAQKITISNHVNFVSGGQMNTMIDEYGIYNNTWYAENGKRQWAVRVWDTLGDVAELSTFKFDDLQISADFYEIYLTDLLLKTVEKSEVDIYDDAFSNMKKYGGMIFDFLKNDADWEKKFSLAEKKEIEDFFKFDNEVKLSQGATEKLTALSKKVFKTDNINLGKDVLTGVSEAINICDTIGKCTDVVDVYLSALNAYTVTKAVQNVGEDFFDVCYDTAEQMRKDGRSKYANWFEQDVDKFKSAVLDGTIFNQLYSEVYDKAIWTVYDLSLKDTLKTWAYRGIQKALNLTSVSPIAWVVATYTATYEVLDLITQLGSRGDNYYYLTYVCPVEYAMGKVCKTYGSNLLSNQSYDNATKLDCCFSMLRRTNNFLWKEYADFCAANLLRFFKSKQNEEEYNYCTLYASFWDKVSCHKDNNALIAEYKTTGYFCPVDVYVYDANNKLALSIVDDVITRNDGNVFALCSNGEKSVVTPSDQKYSVKIVGADSGTFDYYINESANGESTRTVSFEQLDFTKGQTFTGNLPKGEDCNSNEYSLVSNSETIYCDYDSNYNAHNTIVNYSKLNGTTQAYRSSFTFRANTESSEKAEWSVTGAEYTVNTDGSCTVKEAKGDFSITCVIKDESGKIISKDTETIKIKHGFFDKLIAFFRGLFGSLPKITQ